MRNKKYLCVGGYVHCSDLDKHYVSSHKLPSLYGVRGAECMFTDDENAQGLRNHGLIVLKPDSSGKYILK